ncbi:hypothetical protein DBR42_05690 [Pelomonas sp. HMWF004]|nr:hypothetical protein DBR42_05690 [Pelomonas sp. HMWF004]
MKPITPFAAMALLAGCSSFSGLQPATPADYTGPTANVADQVVPVSPQQLHIFEITQVDGRRLSSTSMATLRSREAGSFPAAPVALTNELPLLPSRVQLQVATQYATPLLALQGASCQVQGEVALTPQAGKAYRVAGRIAAEACEAWIEDIATGQRVTTTVSGRGQGR